MHRRHKKPYAVIFAVVVALVIFGALRDMDRVKNPPPAERSAMRMHYADDAHDFEKLPRDTSPVMIRVGTAAQQDDGSYTLTSSDIKPITLPQREVGLAIIVQGDVPSSFSDFNRIVEGELNVWKRKNNKISEILLEWQSDAPDLEKLGTLATSLRSHLKEDYWTGLGLQRSWFEKSAVPASWREKLPAGVRDYVYDLNEAKREGETIEQTVAALESYGIPFLIRITEKMDEKEGLALMDVHPKFQGFVVIR